MLPAVSISKDEVVTSRSLVHVDTTTDMFQLPQSQQPSTAAVLPPSRPGVAPVDAPLAWPPAPVITRTAATPMGTPHESPRGSSNDLATTSAAAAAAATLSSKNLRNTLNVDRLSPAGATASSGIVRARVRTSIYCSRNRRHYCFHHRRSVFSLLAR